MEKQNRNRLNFEIVALLYILSNECMLGLKSAEKFKFKSGSFLR